MDKHVLHMFSLKITKTLSSLLHFYLGLNYCCTNHRGFHVLLYIQRFGDNDIYGIDEVSNMPVK